MGWNVSLPRGYLMKKILYLLSCTIVFSSLAYIVQAEEGHITEQDYQTRKIDEDNALHKGQKGIKYKERYDIRVDLSKLESVESYTDHKKMPMEMSIEQRDEVHSKLAEALPAGTNFAIWITKFKENNVASIMLALPKGGDDLSFKGIDFVLSSGPVQHDGFYLGDPDRQIYYAFKEGWTKKVGLKAIAKELKSGASVDIETTIFFRDKHVSKLRRNNPYYEVMAHLLDGDINGYADIDNYTDKVSFATRVRADQVKYLRDNALVSNVVPNLPLPKTK